MAEGGGHVITLILNYLCKCFRTKHLEARGFEPLFRHSLSRDVRRWPVREDSPAIGKRWIASDGHGCYHFWYHNALLWLASGSDQIRNIDSRWTTVKKWDLKYQLSSRGSRTRNESVVSASSEAYFGCRHSLRETSPGKCLTEVNVRPGRSICRQCY